MAKLESARLFDLDGKDVKRIKLPTPCRITLHLQTVWQGSPSEKISQSVRFVPPKGKPVRQPETPLVTSPEGKIDYILEMRNLPTEIPGIYNVEILYGGSLAKKFFFQVEQDYIQ